ncbi:MAG TPA: PIN domain-containing protein [Thermoanaerobaculia bacterium]|nr:PIN domain-containing protein [Thermoanaerobaculia bacterium]
MKKIILDTNVVVSFLTDRNQEQQEQAGRLFAAAADGEVALVVPQAVITELVYVLRNFYGREAREVAATIDDLLALPGVTVVDEVAWPLVLDLWPEKIPEFADALLAAIARHGRYDAVATFDLKLRRALEREGLLSHW